MSNHDPWGQPYEPPAYEAHHYRGDTPPPPPRPQPTPVRPRSTAGFGPSEPSPPPPRAMPQAGYSPHTGSPDLNLPTVEFATLTDPSLVRLDPEDTGEQSLQPTTGPPAAVDTLDRAQAMPSGHGDAWGSLEDGDADVATIPRQKPAQKPGQKGSPERPIGPASRKQLGPDWTASPLRFSMAAVVTLAVLAVAAVGIVALGTWINP